MQNFVNELRNAKTFGDLASKSVFQNLSATCHRVDVVFDAYKFNYVKQGTRDVPLKDFRQIRKIVDSLDALLPDP